MSSLDKPDPFLVDPLDNRPELVMAVMSSSNRLGGAERGTIETARADTARGRQWLIVLRNTGPGGPTELCAELGVEYALVDSTRAVHRLMRNRRPTVLYMFGLRWSMSLRLARMVQRRVANRPRFIVAQRGLDVWRKPWHCWADRLTHRLVDRYIANSQAAANMLIARVGIPRAKVSVLRTGLGDMWFARPAEQRRRPALSPHVVVVGNDRPEKALDDALAILRTVADLEWRATIYTDVADRLADAVIAAGLSERIRLVIGHRVSPADLDDADVLLQSSVAESLSRAVLEALARGVRVLASDVGDTAALLPANQLFPAGDRKSGEALLRTWLGRESVCDSTRQVGVSRSSPWQQPQPVTVAHELEVADALVRLAHEPAR